MALLEFSPAILIPVNFYLEFVMCVCVCAAPRQSERQRAGATEETRPGERPGPGKERPTHSGHIQGTHTTHYRPMNRYTPQINAWLTERVSGCVLFMLSVFRASCVGCARAFWRCCCPEPPSPRASLPCICWACWLSSSPSPPVLLLFLLLLLPPPHHQKGFSHMNL